MVRDLLPFHFFLLINVSIYGAFLETVTAETAAVLQIVAKISLVYSTVLFVLR